MSYTTDEIDSILSKMSFKDMLDFIQYASPKDIEKIKKFARKTFESVALRSGKKWNNKLFMDMSPYMRSLFVSSFFISQEDFYKDHPEHNVKVDYRETVCAYMVAIGLVHKHNAKVFDVSPTLTKLLDMTKAKPRPLSEMFFPFPTIFINTTLKVSGDVLVHGIFIESVAGRPVVFCCFNTKGDEDFGMYHIVLEDVKKCSGDARRVYDFIMNFLDFLNDPEVQYVKCRYEREPIQHKVRTLRPLRPAKRKIRITGTLKRYLRQFSKGQHSKIKCRFWVRGHFRTLRSTWYKEMRGKRVWIPPYIKGEGILINRNYKVKKGGEGKRKRRY